MILLLGENSLAHQLMVGSLSPFAAYGRYSIDIDAIPELFLTLPQLRGQAINDN
jgi:hypothetical protein